MLLYMQPLVLFTCASRLFTRLCFLLETVLTHSGPHQELRSSPCFSMSPIETASWPHSLGLAHGRGVVQDKSPKPCGLPASSGRWWKPPVRRGRLLGDKDQRVKGGWQLPLEGATLRAPLSGSFTERSCQSCYYLLLAGLQWRSYHPNGHRRRCWQQCKPQPPSLIQPSTKRKEKTLWPLYL